MAWKTYKEIKATKEWGQVCDKARVTSLCQPKPDQYRVTVKRTGADVGRTMTLAEAVKCFGTTIKQYKLEKVQC